MRTKPLQLTTTAGLPHDNFRKWVNPNAQLFQARPGQVKIVEQSMSPGAQRAARLTRLQDSLDPILAKLVDRTHPNDLNPDYSSHREYMEAMRCEYDQWQRDGLPGNKKLAALMADWVRQNKFKDAHDTKVVVPGFGVNIFELTSWHQQGFQVLGVESTHDTEGDSPIRYVEHARYQLDLMGLTALPVIDYQVFSGEADVPTGDVVVWTHPQIRNAVDPNMYRMLKMYGREGSLVILQTEYIHQLKPLMQDTSLGLRFTPLAAFTGHGKEMPLFSVHCYRQREGQPIKIVFVIGILEQATNES